MLLDQGGQDLCYTRKVSENCEQRGRQLSRGCVVTRKVSENCELDNDTP